MSSNRAAGEPAGNLPDRHSEDSFDAETARAASGPLFASLGCAIALLILFAWLADQVFKGGLVEFDSSVRSLVHRFASPAVTQLMLAFTFLGSFEFLSVLFVILIAAAFRFQFRRQAAWFAIAMAGELLLEFTLKLAYHRARPDAFFVTHATGYSFPSGHALGSFCFYGVAAGLSCARIQARGLRIVLYMASVALILAIGLSRIYLGVHYPSDVIAGYLAGGVWVSSLLVVARGRRLFKPTPGPAGIHSAKS